MHLLLVDLRAGTASSEELHFGKVCTFTCIFCVWALHLLLWRRRIALGGKGWTENGLLVFELLVTELEVWTEFFLRDMRISLHDTTSGITTT